MLRLFSAFCCALLCAAALAQSVERGSHPPQRAESSSKADQKMPVSGASAPIQAASSIQVAKLPEGSIGSAKAGQSDLEAWAFVGTILSGLTAILLVVIAARQLRMFEAQLKLMNRSLADSEIVARAAKLSADTAAKSLQLSEDTAKAQLRAYVSVQSIQFELVKGSTTFTHQAHIRIKNNGSTPAHNLAVLARGREEMQPDNWEFGDDQKMIAGQMLYPGQEKSVVVHGIAKASNPLNDFSIWGKVVYRDIYGLWWCTGFNYIHTRPPVNFHAVENDNGESGPYKTGEEAFAGVHKNLS